MNKIVLQKDSLILRSIAISNTFPLMPEYRLRCNRIFVSRMISNKYSLSLRSSEDIQVYYSKIMDCRKGNA